MDDDDDLRVLVLQPVATAKYVTKDSIKISADCGHECFIGERFMSTHMDPDMETTTRCLSCAGITAENLPDKRAALLPGQRDMLDKIFGKEAMDKFITENNIEEST